MHLAHGVARQLGDHKALFGHLEVGQAVLEGGHHRIGGHLVAGLGDHHRHADLAKVGVGHAHQSAFGHAGHLVDEAFHLGRVHVVAAADDQVFAAPHDAHITARVHRAHVTGFEKPIGGELFGGFLGHAPIGLEHIGPLDLNAPHLVHAQGVARVVLHPQAHPRQGKAHRRPPALALPAITRIGGIGVGGEHGRLAHAVALQNRVAGAGLPVFEGLDQQRGRSGNEQAHARHRRARQRGLSEHAHIQGGHAHEHAGAGHVGNHPLGVKLGMPQHGAAIQQRPMQGHKQAMHMEDGQGVDQHIPRHPTPIVLQHAGIAEQVVVRQHRALAAPGGAAGVEDGGQIVGPTLGRRVLVAVVRGALEQAAGAVVVQGEHMARAGLKGNFAHPPKVFTGAHHHSGFGIAHKVSHLGALVSGVERQKHMACAQGGQIQQHGLDRLFHLHRHPRARGQIQIGEQIGQHGAGPLQVLPAVVQAVVGLHRRGG